MSISERVHEQNRKTVTLEHDNTFNKIGPKKYKWYQKLHVTGK